MSGRRIDMAGRALAEFEEHERRAEFERRQRQVREDWKARVESLPSGRATRTTHFVTLTCPVCGRTVGVLPGSSAWCPCRPGRVEMVRHA